MSAPRGLAIVLLLLAAVAQAAPGSWVARAAPLRVAVAGHAHTSAALVPPALAGVPLRVGWRFATAGHRPLQAWLCQGGHCLALPARRGRLPAPAAWRADAPLHFRFRLPADKTRAVTVSDLQVRVAY